MLSSRSLGNAGTSPEEGQFVIDSGASVHMLGKKDPTSLEQELFEDPGTP